MKFILAVLALTVMMVYTRAITAEYKTLLINLHNQYRTKLLNCSVPGQPPAKTMPMMKWHTGIAEKAQKWSDTCKVGHDTYADRAMPDMKYVGQNWAGNPSVQNGFLAWFNEYSHYNFAQNSCSGVCGHYTQVVWAKSIYLGCGVTKCPREKFPYGFSIVCNYGPAGNFNNERPYVQGSSTQCKK